MDFSNANKRKRDDGPPGVAQTDDFAQSSLHCVGEFAPSVANHGSFGAGLALGQQVHVLQTGLPIPHGMWPGPSALPQPIQNPWMICRPSMSNYPPMPLVHNLQPQFNPYLPSALQLEGNFGPPASLQQGGMLTNGIGSSLLTGGLSAKAGPIIEHSPKRPKFTPGEALSKMGTSGQNVYEKKVQEVEDTAVKAYEKLLREGKGVTLQKVMSDTLSELGAYTLESLGLRVQHIPCLRTLSGIEGKINAFIQCHVMGRKVTTLYDLIRGLCEEEGVKEFEDLGLGPVVYHPLVVEYFSLSGVSTVHKITAIELIEELVHFLNKRTGSNPVDAPSFLSSVAQSRELPSSSHLCVRIQSLGMYIGLIYQAKRKDKEVVKNLELNAKRRERELIQNFELTAKCKEIKIMKNFELTGKCMEKELMKNLPVKQRVHTFLASIQEKRKPAEQPKHIVFVHESSEEEGEIDAAGCKSGNTSLCTEKTDFTTCPYPSAAEERIRSNSLHTLVTKFKHDYKLPDLRVAEFIETWKNACHTYSVSEVFKQMLERAPSPSSRSKNVGNSSEKIQRKLFKQSKMFRTHPAIDLLNVAVLSMKAGHWDSMYDDFSQFRNRKLEGGNEQFWEFADVSVEKKESEDVVEADIKATTGERTEIVADATLANCGQVLSFTIEHFGQTFDSQLEESEKSTMKEKLWWHILRWVVNCEKLVAQRFSEAIYTRLGYKDFLEFLESNLHCFPSRAAMLLGPNISKHYSGILSQRLIAFTKQFLHAVGKDDCVGYQDGIKREYCRQFNMEVACLEDGLFQSACDGGIPENGTSFKSILFACALSATACYANSQSETVNAGVLGARTSDDALKCLQTAPCLYDLKQWSQWDAVFAPSLGPFLDWAEAIGSANGLHILVTCRGNMLRIDGLATMEKFIAMIAKDYADEAALQLVSLVALYGGIAQAPKELLQTNAMKSLNLLSEMGDKSLQKARSAKCTGSIKSSDGQLIDNSTVPDCVTIFILKCLQHIPIEFRAFAGDIFLSAFSQFVSKAPLCLLQSCSRLKHHMILHEVGVLLGIPEWISDYKTLTSNIHLDSDHVLKAEICNMNTTLMGEFDSKAMSPDAELSGQPCAYGGMVDACADLSCQTISVVNDTVVNEITPCDEMLAAKVIETIRREEFGLGEEVVSKGDILQKQHARMGRALQCLSQNLYSEDCHFILELIQNADDNAYNDKVRATLAFLVNENRVQVFNNEKGFTASNIRALCDVANSTKSGSCAGYIGHKGIGFKSVFRVTDAPEIHSNGFHVKFDISESTLGFILPTIVKAPTDNQSLFQTWKRIAAWISPSILNTRINIPLKDSLRNNTSRTSISEMFYQIHPTLLLFLHKLSCIAVYDEVQEAARIMVREDLGNNLFKVGDGNTSRTWLVVREELQASVSRPGINITEIALGFPFIKGEGDYVCRPDLQYVFAFLPVKMYGFKFIIQGDFILPSSREEVDRDSAWNQWLRSEVPRVFVKALEYFKQPEFLSDIGKAITMYMKFVPLDGEVFGFFSPLPRLILSSLRLMACLPTEDKSWSLPCMVLKNWDCDLRSLIPDELLRQYVGLHYLHRDVQISDSLASSLGIQIYGPDVLIRFMKAVSRDDNRLQGFGLTWIRSWLLALHRSIKIGFTKQEKASGSQWQKDVFQELQCLPFIPLSNGSYTSLVEGPVWFAGEDQRLQNFPKLYAELRILHPQLLMKSCQDDDDVSHCIDWINTGEGVKHALVVLGVSAMSAHDVIVSHILPKMSRDAVFLRDEVLVEESLAYCMIHLYTGHCSQCKSDRSNIQAQLRNNAVIMTNKGLKRVGTEYIHFGLELGNKIDISKILVGTDIPWSEVSASCLLRTPEFAALNQKYWRTFFQDLGITDFVQIVPVVKSIASDKPEDEPAQDWKSPELTDILVNLCKTDNGEDAKHDQCSRLLLALDKLWDDCYGQFSRHASKTNTSLEIQVDSYSSFVLQMRGIPWVKSTGDTQLHCPPELIYSSEEVKNLLGAYAPYATPQVQNKDLVKALGFRMGASVDDAIDVLEHGSRSHSNFCASTSQMERLYLFLEKKLKHDIEKVNLFQSRRYIFLPYNIGDDPQSYRHGRFYGVQEVCWDDPTGCLDFIVARITLSESYELPVRSLSKAFPTLYQFFVSDCGVAEQPGFGIYITLLQSIANIAPPVTVSNQIFLVFASLSLDLSSGKLSEEELLHWSKHLRSCCILPTTANKWVPLEGVDQIVCWDDDESLSSRFDDVEDKVGFLMLQNSFNVKDKKAECFEKLIPILELIGVPRFSQVVKREIIFYGKRDAKEIISLMGWVIPYAQRYLKQFHPELYTRLLKKGISNHVKQLKYVLADQLFFRYALQNNCVHSKGRIEAGCLFEVDTLYVAASHEHDYGMLYLEFSRLFFDGKCDSHLANFLHLVTLLMQSAPSEANLDMLISSSQGLFALPSNEVAWTIETGGRVELDTHVAVSYLKRYRDAHELRKRTSASSFAIDAGYKDSALDQHFQNKAQDVLFPAKTSNDKDICKVASNALPAADVLERQSCQECPDAQQISSTIVDGTQGSSSGIALDRDRFSLSTFCLNEQQNELTGRAGEALAFNYLVQKYGSPNVKWLNEKVESGAPYDIIIETTRGTANYIEVKSTRSENKDWFELTTREWDFARQMGDHYAIFRVFVTSEHPRILQFPNPVKLCQDRVLQLVLVAPQVSHST